MLARQSLGDSRSRKTLLMAVLASDIAIIAFLLLLYSSTGDTALLLAAAVMAALTPVDMAILYYIYYRGGVELDEALEGLLACLGARGVFEFRRLGTRLLRIELDEGLLVLSLSGKSASAVLIRNPRILGFKRRPRLGSLLQVKWPRKPSLAALTCSEWAGPLRGPISLPHPQGDLLAVVDGEALGGYIVCPAPISGEQLAGLLARLGLPRCREAGRSSRW